MEEFNFELNNTRNKNFNLIDHTNIPTSNAINSTNINQIQIDYQLQQQQQTTFKQNLIYTNEELNSTTARFNKIMYNMELTNETTTTINNENSNNSRLVATPITPSNKNALKIFSNKENFYFEETIDEPMDVDNSQLLPPSTPASNKPVQKDEDSIRQNLDSNEDESIASGKSVVNNSKTVRPTTGGVNGGPRIVKPIKPLGIKKPATNPIPPTFDFNENEFDNPFKSKPKIGFDASTIPSTITRDDDENKNNEQQESTHGSVSERSNSPSYLSENQKKELNQENEACLSNLNPNENNVTSQVKEQEPHNLINDEWETHKKRSSSNRKSQQHQQHQSQYSPSSKQTSSIVSSTTDLSSVSSSSSSPPPPAHANPLLILSSSSASSAISSNFLSSNTASTSSISNNKNANEQNQIVENNINNNQTENELDEFSINQNSDQMDLDPFKTPSHKLTNKDEKPGEKKQNDEEEKTLISKNQKLKNNLFIETERSSNNANDLPGFENENENMFKEDNQIDFNSEQNDIESESKQGNQITDDIVDSVVFDSIFTNDNDFQSFLDLLEKKEVDNSIKKSPKYSEFARKSLYLQFDPYTQGKSLSPEKVKRLSLIKDKQEAIKFFLSEIAEETEPSILKEETEIKKSIESTNEQSESENNNQILVNLEPAVNESDLNIELNEKRYSNVRKNTAINNNDNDQIDNTKMSATITRNKINIIDNNGDFNSRDHYYQTTNINGFEHKAELSDSNVCNINNNSNSSINSSFKTNELIEHLNIKNENLTSITPKTNERKLSLSSSNQSFNDTNCSNLRANNFNNNQNNITNSSLLDLDKLQLSESKINITTNSQLLADDSIVEELQTIKNKQQSNEILSNKLKQATTASLTKNSSNEIKKQNSYSSTTLSNGTPALSDEDLSSSSSSQQSFSKLLNELNNMKEKEKAYLDQINALEEENEKFRTVAVEFEGIFRNLVNDKEESETKLKNEIIELTKERNHLQEDVIGVERAFDDLHRRFEKLKTKVEEFKKNEESLQKAIETYKQQLDKEKLKYSTLKKHAEEKIELANSEIEKLRKSTSIELQTLKAELRKAEIKISSLELNVQQKEQENTQLTNLLEDLLSKVKPNN